MPSVQAAATLLGSASLYLNIAFGRQLPTLLLLLSSGTVVLCMYVQTVGFSAAGEINQNSRRFCARLKCDRGLNASRLQSRALLSLKPMKVMFGYSNYKEVSTCLELLDFTASVTINLLVTFKRKAY